MRNRHRCRFKVSEWGEMDQHNKSNKRSNPSSTHIENNSQAWQDADAAGDNSRFAKQKKAKVFHVEMSQSAKFRVTLFRSDLRFCSASSD